MKFCVACCLLFAIELLSTFCCYKATIGTFDISSTKQYNEILAKLCSRRNILGGPLELEEFDCTKLEVEFLVLSIWSHYLMEICVKVALIEMKKE